eukprot:ctg_177.g90
MTLPASSRDSEEHAEQPHIPTHSYNTRHSEKLRHHRFVWHDSDGWSLPPESSDEPCDVDAAGLLEMHAPRGRSRARSVSDASQHGEGLIGQLVASNETAVRRTRAVYAQNTYGRRWRLRRLARRWRRKMSLRRLRQSVQRQCRQWKQMRLPYKRSAWWGGVMCLLLSLAITLLLVPRWRRGVVGMAAAERAWFQRMTSAMHVRMTRQWERIACRERAGDVLAGSEASAFSSQVTSAWKCWWPGWLWHWPRRGGIRRLGVGMRTDGGRAWQAGSPLFRARRRLATLQVLPRTWWRHSVGGWLWSRVWHQRGRRSHHVLQEVRALRAKVATLEERMGTLGAARGAADEPIIGGATSHDPVETLAAQVFEQARLLHILHEKVVTWERAGHGDEAPAAPRPAIAALEKRVERMEQAHVLDIAGRQRDYALVSIGARIVSSEPSRRRQLLRYTQQRWANGSMADVSLPRPRHPAVMLRAVHAPQMLVPGQCWRFDTESATVLVHLPYPIRVTAVSVLHLPPDLDPQYRPGDRCGGYADRAAPPGELRIEAVRTDRLARDMSLASGAFNLSACLHQWALGGCRQVYTVSPHRSAHPVQLLRVSLSRREAGCSTCIYKLGVHGSPGTSLIME